MLAITRVVTEDEYCRKMIEAHAAAARMDQEAPKGHRGG